MIPQQRYIDIIAAMPYSLVCGEHGHVGRNIKEATSIPGIILVDSSLEGTQAILSADLDIDVQQNPEDFYVCGVCGGPLRKSMKIR